MGKVYTLLAAGFTLLIGVHWLVWKFYFAQPESLFFKYYAFLAVLYIFLITLMVLAVQLAKDFFAFMVIGLIFLKFLAMYIIRKKLMMSSLDAAGFHLVFPYFIMTILLTWFSAKLLAHDKKH